MMARYRCLDLGCLFAPRIRKCLRGSLAMVHVCDHALEFIRRSCPFTYVGRIHYEYEPEKRANNRCLRSEHDFTKGRLFDCAAYKNQNGERPPCGCWIGLLPR